MITIVTMRNMSDAIANRVRNMVVTLEIVALGVISSYGSPSTKIKM